MAVVDMLPDYAKRLVPADYDRSTVAGRKDQLTGALSQAGIEIVSSFEAGSFSHGTAVKDRSDVDLMIWVKIVQQPLLPSSALSTFKLALSTLGVRLLSISSPTVRVEFWTPPHFELVPSFYSSTVSDVSVYEIPGRRDEWVLSAPRAHNLLVNQQNERLYMKLKPLVRLLKAWKYYVQAPLSSFYLEMRATEYALGESVILYYIDLPRVLRRIVGGDVADMNDPAGITGRIPACSSDEKRRTTKLWMQSAIMNLDAAEAQRQAGDRSGYWTNMAAVFGNDFPYPSG